MTTIDPRLAIRQMQDDYDQAAAIAIPQAEAVTSPADKPALTIAPPPAPIGDVGGAMPAIQLPKPEEKRDNKLATDQNRVSYLQRSGSGIDQIMHPVDAAGNPDASKKPGIGHRIGSVLARVGDIAGTALFPSVMAQVPGTTLHHQMLTHQAEHNVTNDLDVATKEAKIAKDAATDQPANEFELFLRQNPKGTVQEYERAKGGDKLDMALTQHGLKRDANGNVVADPDSPVTKRAAAKDEFLKTQSDSVKAGTALKEAEAELARSKNDPNSAAYKTAQQKLEVAQMNAQSMALRGRAAWANYLMHSQGVGESGATLPGAMLDDNGNSVGTAFSQNVRPTGQERGKADLANSADEQLKDMKSIVQKRPDIFGPAAGRTTDFTVWMGSQDPDAQRFRAARTIAGDHLAGVFGGRSEAALVALDAAIGHYKDNPKAIVAGLDQLSKANTAFVKAGTVRTKGGSHDNTGNGGGAATQSGHTIKVNGKNYQYKGSGDTADLKNYAEVK